MRRPAAGMFALALVAAACAVPTDVPNWDVIWNLPLPDSGQTIAVSSFLPNGVTLVGTAPTQSFQAAVSSVPNIVRTLGAQCSVCTTTTAPKPAFTAPPATTVVTLTAGTALNTAVLAAGSQITVTMNNQFTFDPIRPPGGSPGTVTLAVTNGAATLGTATLGGTTTAIPAGQLTNVVIPLSGTINTASPIVVTMTMDSPAGAAGSPVAMNVNHLFTVSSVPVINVSQASVTIAAQPLQSRPQTLALNDGPLAAAEKRVADSASTQGSMFLTIRNPLTVGATVTLTFTGTKEVETDAGTVIQPITPVVKTFALPTGAASGAATTVQVDFSGQELRRILGSQLTAAMTGTTTAGSTVVLPTSSITIFSRLQVRLYTREFH